MIQPSLFIAIWVTLGLPIAIISFIYILNLSDKAVKDYNDIQESFEVVGLLLLVYAIIGLTWHNYVLEVYNLQHSKVEVYK